MSGALVIVEMTRKKWFAVSWTHLKHDRKVVSCYFGLLCPPSLPLAKERAYCSPVPLQ